MLKTLEEAEQELARAENDVIADFGDEGLDGAYQDVVESVLWQCTNEVARELCRTKLGYVPRSFESRLGKKDWLES